MGISVIIPVYNVEKYLPRCLDSVIAQSDCVQEIIIVNDGSTDNSLSICESYLQKDERIQIISQENQGLPKAVRAGIARSTCDLIGFVDSDDYIEADMFKLMYEAITHAAADVCICNYDKVDDDGIVLHKTDLGCREGVYKKAEGSFDINILPTIEDVRYISASRWNKLFKREQLVSNIAYNTDCINMGEDLALSIPVIMAADTLVYIDRTLYHYVCRETSITHSYKQSFFTDCLKSLDVLDRAAKYYEYKFNNFADCCLTLILYNCLSKIAHSKLKFKEKKRAYKEIGDCEHVKNLFSSVKIKSTKSHKRVLIFKLLKLRFYGVLAAIY